MHFFSRRNWQLGLVGQILVYTNPNKNAKRKEIFHVLLTMIVRCLSNLLGFFVVDVAWNDLLIRLFVCVSRYKKPHNWFLYFHLMSNLLSRIGGREFQLQFSESLFLLQQVKETRQLVLFFSWGGEWILFFVTCSNFRINSRRNNVEIQKRIEKEWSVQMEKKTFWPGGWWLDVLPETCGYVGISKTAVRYGLILIFFQLISLSL